MTRLNKHLALVLGISRREADTLIEEGRVLVDGKTATLGQRFEDGLDILVNGKTIGKKTDFLYLALNKPTGYVCSKKQQGENPTIYDLLPARYKTLKTVGRLDKDSSGLILLTNDGDFAHQMTHPSFRKTKVYEVELDKPLYQKDLMNISKTGVELEDGVSRFNVAKIALDESDESKKSKAYRVVMHEGRNRQIRRTFASLGYTVTKLHRIEFGNYKIDGLEAKGFQVLNYS